MMLIDYSNDENYYSQGFEKKGMVSVWVGLKGGNVDPQIDVLQDLCGVGYYKIDDQENNCFYFKEVELGRLLNDLSYSKSFVNSALVAAREKEISSAYWVVAQYDFNYVPEEIIREIKNDPVFIGSFTYSIQ